MQPTYRVIGTLPHHPRRQGSRKQCFLHGTFVVFVHRHVYAELSPADPLRWGHAPPCLVSCLFSLSLSLSAGVRRSPSIRAPQANALSCKACMTKARGAARLPASGLPPVILFPKKDSHRIHAQPNAQPNQIPSCAQLCCAKARSGVAQLP